MSNKPIGNTNLKNPVPILPVNSTIQKVSINIPSYKNRKTKMATIKKYFKEAGGFIPALCPPVYVAELPNGERFLFDGDHRRHMQKLVNPSQTDMEAFIIPAKDVAEISRYFVLVNKTARTPLTPEEIFVHDVWSNDPDSIAVEKNLKQAKLAVSLETGEQNDFVGSATGFKGNKVLVNIHHFKEALSNQLTNVVIASQTIQTTWNLTRGNVTKMPGELLYAFAKAYKEFPALLNVNNKKINPLWNQWLKQKSNDTVGDFIVLLKGFGGNIHNREELCMAKGILMAFQSWATGNKYITQNAFYHKAIGTAIANIQVDIEKKK